MPSTVIQIRRKTSGADPGPGQLAEGELGFAYDSEKLFIGAVSPTDPPLQIGGVGSGAASLDELSDVTLASPMLDEFLRFDGSQWVNAFVAFNIIEDANFSLTGSGGTPAILNFSQPNTDGAWRFFQDTSPELDSKLLIQKRDSSIYETIAQFVGGPAKLFELLQGNLHVVQTIEVDDCVNTACLNIINPGPNSATISMGESDFFMTDGGSMRLGHTLGNVPIFMGSTTTDGTWKIVRSGTGLAFQRREGGTFTTKYTMTPASDPI